MAVADELEKSSVLYMKRLGFVKQLAEYIPREETGDVVLSLKPPPSRQNIFGGP
jgi:hypothetical protein